MRALALLLKKHMTQKIKAEAKKVEKMKREEIIYALRKHSHPSWYHDLLDRDTEMLRALLAYYEAGGSGEPPMKVKKNRMPISVVMVVHVPKGETLKNKQRFGGK